MHKIIFSAYYDPSVGMQYAKKLYQKLKDKGVTLKQIKDFIAQQEVHQLNKKPTRIKNYFPIVAKYKNEIYQVDLADMSGVASTNSNYKWLLCSIDVFTRYADVVPLKNKTATSVTEAMEDIFLKTGVPDIINCDNGSEFISQALKHLTSDNGVDVRYVPVGDHRKLGVVDRFIRSLRRLIHMYQTG